MSHSSTGHQSLLDVNILDQPDSVEEQNAVLFYRRNSPPGKCANMVLERAFPGHLAMAFQSSAAERFKPASFQGIVARVSTQIPELRLRSNRKLQDKADSRSVFSLSFKTQGIRDDSSRDFRLLLRKCCRTSCSLHDSR
jgi:hypothetical protein